MDTPLIDDVSLQILRTVPAALLIVDEEGTIELATDEAHRLFDYPAGSLVGMAVEVLVPPETRPAHPELRRAFGKLANRRTMAEVARPEGVTRSGSRIPLDIKLHAVDLGARRVVVAAITDMTRVRTEELKTETVFDAAATAMVLVDHDGLITMANTEACHMFGYEREELLGQPVELLISAELRRTHQVYRSNYVAVAATRPMGSGDELQGRRADGTEFPLEIGLIPLPDHGSRMTMATILDVTDRRLHEQEMRAQNDNLRHLNNDLEHFAYSVSHDLKAPLTSLEGLLRCIGEDVADADWDAVDLNAGRARSMSHRLSGRIDGLLAIAQSHGCSEEEVDLDIRTLVEDVVEELATLIAEQDVLIDIDICPDLTILSQPTRLSQIMKNLLENAAKYTDRSRSKHRVVVAATVTDDELSLTVADNGAGIPADSLDVIFRRFYRAGDHHQPGLGLGLALVKRNVERLGGEITVESSTEGTRFEVALPVDRQGDG
ncbi:MAG: PAS domain S-box protein [Actinomycetia bacterium]|nr:PAS domain S-box protein [Actinomycetes bacterium]